MKVSKIGRVTIPKSIRDHLGLVPGTEIEVEIDGDSALLTPTPNSSRRMRKVLNDLRGTGGIKLTTDQIMELTRGED